VVGDVEVDDLAVFVSRHQEHIEDPKGGCGDGEKVDGHKLFGMIVEEGPTPSCSTVVCPERSAPA
jgi:hypothetical protein